MFMHNELFYESAKYVRVTLFVVAFRGRTASSQFMHASAAHVRMEAPATWKKDKGATFGEAFQYSVLYYNLVILTGAFSNH